MSEETHVYNHYDPREPEIDLSVNQTTRGMTWGIEIKGATTPEQAVELFKTTAGQLGDLLKAEYAESKEEGK